MYNAVFILRVNNFNEKIFFKVKKGLSALKGDKCVMTYRGHQVLNTLMRCRFSPSRTTGQRYIYTGSADGALCSKIK